MGIEHGKALNRTGRESLPHSRLVIEKQTLERNQLMGHGCFLQTRGSKPYGARRMKEFDSIKTSPF